MLCDFLTEMSGEICELGTPDFREGWLASISWTSVIDVGLPACNDFDISWPAEGLPDFDTIGADCYQLLPEVNDGASLGAL